MSKTMQQNVTKILHVTLMSSAAARLLSCVDAGIQGVTYGAAELIL
jgi:hypothetical protein